MPTVSRHLLPFDLADRVAYRVASGSEIEIEPASFDVVVFYWNRPFPLRERIRSRSRGGRQATSRSFCESASARSFFRL